MKSVATSRTARRSCPEIVDPNEVVIEFYVDGEKPDDWGRRHFFAYWLDHNVGPRCNETGVRGQVFFTNPNTFAAGADRDGKTVRHFDRRAYDAVIATHTPAQVDKARELIEDGGIVEIRRAKNRVFTVVSMSGTDQYLTAANACTCKAGLRGTAVCYHRVAAQLVTAA